MLSLFPSIILAENTRLKELSTKMETVLAVLGDKEEKDKLKDDRLSMIEQSVSSLVKCMESLQQQASMNQISSSQTLLQEPPISESRSIINSPLRSIKLDLPRFDGSNALQWLYHAEQFFDFYETSDFYRLKIASVHFDGPVVPWFQMIQKSGIVVSWKSLAKAIEQTYGPSVFENPRSSLFKLFQEGSVMEYYNTFTELANRVEGLSDDALLDCFLSGLKPEIQRDIIPWQPVSITKAVTLARLYEEKPMFVDRTPKFKAPIIIEVSNLPRKAVIPPASSSGSSKWAALPPIGPPPLALPSPSGVTAKIPVSTTASTTTPPFRKMSFREMQQRRAQGLCYNCDEKFSPMHKCANRRLLLLQWDDDLTELGEESEDQVQEKEQECSEEPQSVALNALESSWISGTMRFNGLIKEHSVQILLDGGSDDSFIRPKLAKFLQLPIIPTKPLKVLVGDGNALFVEGLVSDLQVQIQTHKLTFPVYLLPIVGADIILGANWLATLGPHITDYKNRTLEFFYNNAKSFRVAGHSSPMTAVMTSPR